MNSEIRKRYGHVFRPFRIGRVEIKNRIFVPAHTTNFAEDFRPTETHVNYHRERAKGGVGLIIIECLRVHKTSLGRSGGLSGNDRRTLPGLRKIVDVIHAENIPAFVQITHAGRHSENFVERLPAWGPSSIPWTGSGEMPHAMTRSEIREVIACYRDAVELALEAGFDGMEIHFGHGHLLHQFLSPASNNRTDEYGGSDENRMRFPMEVLRAVVDQLRDRAPLGVRLSVDELMTGGLDADASRHIAHRAATEAGVSFINASVASYNWPSIGYHVADMSYPPHPYLDLTVRLRDAIGSLPMLTANRYTTLADAEEALATGAIDMVGMMRAHIADPEIIKKTLEGREDRIRPCVASNFCIEQLALHRPITCMMNPRVGKEKDWPVPPPQSEKSKSILVVGGGPAGMEFARVAALRRHRVTLWEKSPSLGGLLTIAATGVGRSDLGKMKAYLEREVLESGAIVECEREATVDDVRAFGADLVVVAAGAEVDAVAIPGLAKALTVTEALAMDRNLWRGGSVLIYDLSGSWGTLTAAETLAASGAEVSIVGKPETALWDINLYSRMIAFERLRERNVFIQTRAAPVLYDGGTVTVRETSVGRETILGPFTHVVVATRGVSRLKMLNDFEQADVAVRSIGDANAPHALLQATYAANALARTV
ncbi:MAG: FAD-dependent oxidoreductase [Pseudorhodoplanes sp.]|jgi:2,4-dienoyl-CoA reductase-like NADH-dependent reductase (Old Yellow Enzyme family)/thioredoxin reductase|nr:FAD-dependent oxidoreductase [Pseudorhodoplanes sp.]